MAFEIPEKGIRSGASGFGVGFRYSLGAGLVKVSGTDRQRVNQVAKVGQFTRHDMNDIAFSFQNPFYMQQPGGKQWFTLASGGFEPDYDVHVAGFVFQGDKGDTSGGTGALAAGDEAGDLYGQAGFEGFELFGVGAVFQMALFAQQG